MRIGLTGGIGTGKSTVAKMFAAKGARLLHADEFGHSALTYPHEAHFKTVALFGKGILDLGPGTGPVYKIDRKKLAAKVFESDQALTALNRIVHEAVFQMYNDSVALLELSDPKPVIIFEVALLFESIRQSIFDSVIAVTCERKEQIRRAMSRDGATREEIEARMARQYPFVAYKQFCQHVIDTNDWSTVPGQVDQIWEKLTA